MRSKQGVSLNPLAWLPVILLALAAGCANLQDCPRDSVLGNNVPRVRSSHLRMELADTASAARRFLPYALMAAYAYRDGKTCHADASKNPVPAEHALELLEHLKRTTKGTGGAWERRVPNLETPGACEDEQGLLLHVWSRDEGNRTHVVIAFRGTSGFDDWIYGNLWWFTRGVLSVNQLTRARHHAKKIIAHFTEHEARAGRQAPRFTSTGHSLGGGLAQHVLYAHPGDIEQAIVFAPSAVTGFDDLSRDRKVAGCSCREDLNAEARIIRIYESYEILAGLRIFHKLFFDPHRHIQEVRFPFAKTWNPVARHNMRALALHLGKAADASETQQKSDLWYAGKDQECTAEFQRLQMLSCKAEVGDKETDWELCPQ